MSEDGIVKNLKDSDDVVFLPDVNESLRIDFRSEEREKFYVERWEHCLDHSRQTVKQLELANLYNGICKVKVVLDAQFVQQFPEVLTQGLTAIAKVENFCKGIEKQKSFLPLALKVTTVKDNRITKIFQSTERFTKEDLQDQIIVVYNEFGCRDDDHFLAVNLFDVGTQSFFGFPLLMKKPTESIGNAELRLKLKERLSRFFADKSELVLGKKLDDWWNKRWTPSNDDTAKAKSVSFDVHKSVLIARSEVFQAMLTNPTSKESISNQLVITDIKPKIVEKLLEFIYKDSCTDIYLDSLELFVAADKYFLAGLKRLAFQSICRQCLPKLRHDLRLAAFGEFYNEDSLVKHAMREIHPNLSAIIETEEWKEFCRILPPLAIKILTVCHKKTSFNDCLGY